ncbi:hypothetical protein D0Z00_000172 [Geotrichum galactomycetum]|uniref:Uncharacterized protein n=1 Tax=Geotrichum galactomycetum TaxID=27317 RepID=A0ACB6VAT1_9ASCO|nr:hypothetical protein D0Z00_000172 [Geotrichum candidum]
MTRIAKRAPKPKTTSNAPTLGKGTKPELRSATTSTRKTAAAATVLSKELNEFLHQDKDSKKQKQQTKRSTFLSRIGADTTSALPDNTFLSADSYKHTTVTETTQYRRDTVTTIHDLPGKVSKSTLKRRKRKAKSAVLASVNDLGGALPDLLNDAGSAAASTTYKPPAARNTPSTSRPLSAKTTERVVKHEINKFAQTLNNAEFKASPFAALRASISANLVQKAEFIKKPDSMEL